MADFLNLEAWTHKGLTRFLVLLSIDLPSPRVETAGQARQVNGLWKSRGGPISVMRRRVPWRGSNT